MLLAFSGDGVRSDSVRYCVGLGSELLVGGADGASTFIGVSCALPPVSSSLMAELMRMDASFCT
jgi:hypothetical protein